MKNAMKKILSNHKAREFTALAVAVVVMTPWLDG